MEPDRRHHIFVVEDDVALRDIVCGYLEKHELVVTAMGSAEEMLQRIDRLRPDLVLLDVGLPGLSGLEACRKLRADGDQVPVILLTARTEEIDRVLGLEMGADDYLGKPYSARELLARIRAVLRRAGSTPGSPKDTQAKIAIGEHVFVVATRSLHSGGEVRVLNTVEYAMLAELTLNPGVTISRERLMTVSHTRRDAVSLRAVDAAIVRLRKVVEPDAAAPRFIQTVRGHGYLFVPGGAGQVSA